MAMREQFPTRGVLRRPQFRWVDLLVGGAVFALLYGLLRLGLSLRAPFAPAHAASTISTNPARLPVYALRSLAADVHRAVPLGRSSRSCTALRPLASRRAEKVLDPAARHPAVGADPGFLAVIVTFFIAPVPALDRRARVRGDLRDLHVAGVEHDVQLLPLADQPAARARRGRAAHAADEVGAVLEPRRARLDDRAGVERDDELRRRMVLPHRVGGDHRQQPLVRAARHRQLRRDRRARTRSSATSCWRSA